MAGKSLLKYILLSPFSWVYGAVVSVRNWCFDIGILPSKKFDYPVIAVGNLTVGGTGKTPFTEYLVSILCKDFRTAVVSRGYKRKSHGYVLATKNSKPADIGDEPYQIKRKFPDVTIAVDSKRVRAIQKLIDSDYCPDVFILDDAYQHRYVSPDISILLVDYNRLIYNDHLLPAGNLREHLSAKDRASIVVVTKCPHDISPMDMRVITVDLKLYPYQKLYFTTLDVDMPQLVFGGAERLEFSGCSAIALSGIAQPEQFEKQVADICKTVVPLRFADHHNFTKDDYKKIVSAFDALAEEDKVIITTEKDAVRMQNDENFPAELKQHLLYMPIKVRFISYADKDGQSFNSQIISYVEKNRTNMRLSQK